MQRDSLLRDKNMCKHLNFKHEEMSLKLNPDDLLLLVLHSQFTGIHRDIATESVPLVLCWAFLEHWLLLGVGAALMNLNFSEESPAHGEAKMEDGHMAQTVPRPSYPTEETVMRPSHPATGLCSRPLTWAIGNICPSCLLWRMLCLSKKDRWMVLNILNWYLTQQETSGKLYLHKC